jgi:urea transporter
MLESKKETKGNTMEKFSAVITSVANGVEYKTDISLYMAKVVGTVKGLTAHGDMVTKVEEFGPPF